MTYRAMIERIAPACNPLHVEALMRMMHGTLDALSADAFRASALESIACLREAPYFGAQCASAIGMRDHDSAERCASSL